MITAELGELAHYLFECTTEELIGRTRQLDPFLTLVLSTCEHELIKCRSAHSHSNEPVLSHQYAIGCVITLDAASSAPGLMQTL